MANQKAHFKEENIFNSFFQETVSWMNTIIWNTAIIREENNMIQLYLKPNNSLDQIPYPKIPIYI